MWNKPQLLNWMANLLYGLSVVAVLYVLIFVIVHLPIFPIREIKIDGQLGHVTENQVRYIAKEHLKGNFFTLQLTETKTAFEKLPWVRKVNMRRQWPDQLQVTIEEHEPLARWGNIALVNTQGELFKAAFEGKLPVFYGPGVAVKEVAIHYGEFRKILAAANIQIRQISLSQRRAWDLVTDKGMQIALGRVDMQARLRKFSAAYNSTLAKLGVNLEYADLRYPNGFAVRKPKPKNLPNQLVSKV